MVQTVPCHPEFSSPQMVWRHLAIESSERLYGGVEQWPLNGWPATTTEATPLRETDKIDILKEAEAEVACLVDSLLR